MPKSLKTCKYTDHMHIMDRVNTTKTIHESTKAKSQKMYEKNLEHHLNHKETYPEAQAKAWPEEQCTCNHSVHNAAPSSQK